MLVLLPTIVKLIHCSSIPFFSLLMSMKGATLRRVAGMDAVLVAAFSFRMNADLCKSGYRGAFRVGKRLHQGFRCFFVLAAVSLPVPPLKADAPTLPNRFFYPVLTLRVSAYLRLRACEHRRYARPLLISSYISRCCPTGAASAGVDDAARHLPGKGCSAARMGVGLLGQIDLSKQEVQRCPHGGGTCLVTRHFCAKLAVQAFCSSPPGEFLIFPLALSGAYSAALGWLCRQGAGRFAPFRCAHPGRRQPRGSFALRGWPGGMTTAGDFI